MGLVIPCGPWLQSPYGLLPPRPARGAAACVSRGAKMAITIPCLSWACNGLPPFPAMVLRNYGTNDQRTSPASGGLSPRNKRVAEETLRATLGPIISIDELAQRCGLSTRHFARAFQQSFGMPFHRFQLDLKLQHAKRLLAESTASIKDIAIEMRYADQATFTESFTRTIGMPLGCYRRRHTSQGGVVTD